MEVGRRGRGRGIKRVADEELQEEIRNLTARLAAVEAGRHRDSEVVDDSEKENIAMTDGSNDKGLEIKLLRLVLLARSKPRPELSNYDGSLSIEALLDWIS